MILRAMGQAHTHISLERALFVGLALAIAAALFGLAIRQGVVQWDLRLRLPYWDMVGLIHFLDHNSYPSILDLYRFQANEHRPIFTFLFYLRDRNFVSYSGELLYSAIMVFNAVLTVSLFGPLFVRRNLDAVSKILFAAIITYSFFSIFHFENLTWQIQIHEVSGMAFLSLGLLCAAAIPVEAGDRRISANDITLALLAGLCCLVATYSFGFGLAGWPVVIAHGVLARWRWPPLMIFGTIAVFAIVTYALTYTPFEYHTNPIQAASHPWAIIAYILHVIEAPLEYLFQGLEVRPTTAPVNVLIAAVAVVVAFVCIARFYVVPALKPASWLVRTVAFHAAMLLVATLVMALMLSLGRLTINPGFESRYMVVSAIFWCSLLVLLLVTLRRRTARTILLLFGIATLVIGFLPAKHFERIVRDRYQDNYRGGVLATYRRQYWPQLPALYPAGPPLFEVWNKPRPPFSSFADRAPFKWIGAKLTDLPQAEAKGRCFGYIDAIVPFGEAPEVITVTGWAFVATPGTRLRWVIITDESGRGLGAGSTGLERNDVRANFAEAGINGNAADERYSGYRITAVGTPGQTVVAWGIDDAGRACRFYI